jgi:hypothetical protein
MPGLTTTATTCQPPIPLPADLVWKPGFARCVQRHLALQNARHGCLVTTVCMDELDAIARDIPLPPLQTVDFDRDPLLIPRLFCDRAERQFLHRAQVAEDDWLPYVSPRYGTGIIGAMLTGRIHFGSDTSWYPPAGATLEEVTGFQWGRSGKWMDIAIEGLAYMEERMAGQALVHLEGYHAPLEFAELLRGSQLYLDLYLDPQGVHRLLERCDDALWWLYQQIALRVPSRFPGSMARVLWMPRALPFLSDDASALISAEHYRQFGAPYADRMFQRHGGGFLHVHTAAYHQQDNLIAMRHMTAFNWRTDPNVADPMDVLPRLMPGAEQKIAYLVATADQVRRELPMLARGRFILLVMCRDHRERQEMVDLVRDRAPIT